MKLKILSHLNSNTMITAPKIRGLALFFLAFGLQSTAIAEVYKCVGSNGKTIFSDQPCTAGQSGGTVKAASASQGSSASDANSAIKGTIAQQSAECARQGKVISDMMNNGSAKTMDELVSMTKRLNAQCKNVPLPEELTEQNSVKDRQTVKNADCAVKRNVLDERRPKLAGMSEQYKKDFASVERDYATNCR